MKTFIKVMHNERAIFQINLTKKFRYIAVKEFNERVTSILNSLTYNQHDKINIIPDHDFPINRSESSDSGYIRGDIRDAAP